MAISVVTPAAMEPVSLAEAKLHMRVDSSDDDAYILGLIATARRWVESFRNQALVTQTLDWYLDSWPASGQFDVPRPPLQSVTSITLYDTANAASTVSSAVYFVDTVSQPGRISLAYGQSWPTTTLRDRNAIKIRFVAGYGSAESVPNEVRQAILLIAGDLYENRENTLIGQGLTVQQIPFAARALLWPERIGPWGRR